MRLDGRPATSGTIVIGAGQQGAIELPWGTFDLVFNPDVQPQNVQLIASPPQIVFDGTDNPLGLTSVINIPVASGGSATLNIAVYAIGDGAAANRIVHFTVA
jgi:hypothetical protein